MEPKPWIGFGQGVLPPTPDTLRQHLKVRTGLTPREVDVVAGLIGGRDSKAIGRLLNISHHTIRNHIQSVYTKLNCNAQQALIGWLETQGMHESFRRHYLYLQLQPGFKRLLRDIAQRHGGDPPQLLSIHDEQDGWPTTVAQSLRQAGWTVIEATPATVDDHEIQAACTHVLDWRIHPPHRSRHPASACPSSWVILTLDEASPPSSESVTHISLSDHPDVYSVLLKLLTQLAPDCDPSHCQAMYQRLLGQAHPHLSQSSVAEPPAPGVTWNLPPLMSYYIKRPQLTQHIWRQLHQDMGQGTVSLVGLRGMGGVGKTTLAIEAIHYPQWHYHFRGWFRAETVALLKTDYLDLGIQMNLFTQTMNERQQIMAVKAWLQTQPSTLLVYDNAPDMNTIRDVLPHRGHVLITSRNQRMPHPIDVEGMQAPEAITLLNQLVPEPPKQQKNRQRQLKVLAQELSHLPLALAQAGAYMAEHQLSIESYLERYQVLHTQLLAQHTLPPQDPHEPIYITWDMNIQAIQQHPQGQTAMQLLDVIAHLYPENIPKHLLSQHVFHAADASTLLTLETTMQPLRQHSLVKTTADDVSIHRLIHAYLRHRHPDHQASAILNHVMDTMSILHQEDPWDYMRLQSLLPHLEHIKAHSTSWLTPPQHLQLDILLGWLYYLSGRYDQAKQIHQTILPTSIQLHGPAHPHTAAIYRALAWVYHDLGQSLEAKVWVEKALAVFEQHDRKQHAQTCRFMGLIYRDLGQPLKAKQWLGKALTAVDQHDKTHHIGEADIYRDLGRVEREQGHPLKAKAWFEKAFMIYQKHNGDQHIRIAWIYRGLGLVYRDLGQPCKAKTWLEKALFICQKHYGEQHVWTAKIYWGLGWTCWELKQPIKAKTWFEKALSIFQKNYGNHHIWTAWIYDGLGWTCMELNTLEQALSWYSKALITHQKYNNEHHIWSLPTHHGLAWVYFKRGQLESAKTHLKQAQQIIHQHQHQGYQFNQKLHQSLAQLQQVLMTTTHA